MTETLPGRASDSGPDTTTCTECHITFAADAYPSHDCRANWQWYDWVTEAEEFLSDARRESVYGEAVLGVAGHKQARIEYMDLAIEAIQKAKEKL